MSESTTAPPPLQPRSRGAVVVSISSQLTFLLALVAACAIAWIKQEYTLLTAMCGVAATNATTVVSYWVGSSEGSARKTELSAAQTVTPIPPPGATTTTTTSQTVAPELGARVTP